MRAAGAMMLRRGKAAVSGRGQTRVLVLLWCTWLLGAWSVTLWIDSTIPAVRWMIFSALIGLMAIWPALRLSQSSDTVTTTSGGGGPRPSESVDCPLHRSDWAIGVTLLDWLCLMLVFQAVIWPLRLSMRWSFVQTWWLDSAIAVWSGLTALIIAWGRRFHSGPMRTAAMGACLALLLAEPVVMRLAGTRWRLRVSPIETIWALTVEPKNFVPEPWITHVTLGALAALLGWLLFTVAAAMIQRRDQV